MTRTVIVAVHRLTGETIIEDRIDLLPLGVGHDEWIIFPLLVGRRYRIVDGAVVLWRGLEGL